MNCITLLGVGLVLALHDGAAAHFEGEEFLLDGAVVVGVGGGVGALELHEEV